MQKRKHTNPQQVKVHSQITNVQHHNAEIGIVSIPTKNTYIDLDVQEFYQLYRKGTGIHISITKYS